VFEGETTMLSRAAEDRLDRTERDVHKRTCESAIRPLRDSAARVEAPKTGADPVDEPPPADAQSVYHLMRSIAHRLDRLEQRLSCQEAAERSRSGRRARFLRSAAVLVAAAVAAVVVWRVIAAGPRPDPFLVPVHRPSGGAVGS
jgi:hypothetical protein